MKATTHTELYRPFRGKLRRMPLTALVLAKSGIRTAYRSKKTLLLFAVPWIQALTTCFVVHTAFSFQDADVASEVGGRGRMLGAALLESFTNVERQIVMLLGTTQFFSLIVLAWYGAGLVADDRRLKAHLLYFARPVTRVGYVLGKLGVVGYFGGLAIVAPATVVLLVAVFASPDWSFLKERGSTILAVEAYAFTWLFVHALGILAISSLAQRKNHALVASVGLFVLTSAVSEFLAEVLDRDSWRLMSMFGNFEALAQAWLGVSSSNADWPIGQTYAVLAGVALVSALVLFRQVGRMEREA